MTNREWLSTLTDEEFAIWVFGAPVPIVYRKVNGHFEPDGLPDKLAPRLEEIKRRSNSSYHELLDWLSKERSEHKSWKLEVNNND